MSVDEASVLVAETTVVVQARGELRPKALLFGRIHYSKMLGMILKLGLTHTLDLVKHYNTVVKTGCLSRAKLV